MHDTSIRELEPERDADAVVALIAESEPFAVVSAAAWLHRARTLPARAGRRSWLAETDGQPAGYAFAFRSFFTEGSNAAFGGVTVTQAQRRRGIGTELHALVDEHVRSLEATSLQISFLENDAGTAFASRLGYREARAEAESTLDPRAVAERASADIDLRPVTRVDPHDVYEVDVTSTRDVPALEPIDHVPYDEWEQHVLQHPLFQPDGSFVAYVDGRPAAVSLLIATLEHGRAANMFTGTLREFRGRGLALAVKLASIEWAAANGITSMATSNDERNAPMLAVNRRLGYRPAARHVEYVREL